MSAQKELINVTRTVTTPLVHMSAAVMMVSLLMSMGQLVMVSLIVCTHMQTVISLSLSLSLSL